MKRAWPRRAVVLSLGILLLATQAPGFALSKQPKQKDASFTQHVYGEPGTQGSRAYWLYLPARKSNKPIPLVVYLHGCLQTAADAAAQTRYNELAAELGFAVVYPDQNVTTGTSYPLADGNGTGCWNWFLRDHQQRGSGEPASIAGITQEVIAAHRIDTNRVYVEGISAGADMAVILASTYPDLYAAAAALAGCAYATCGDATGALAHQAMGAHARVVPMFVEQGTADTLNAYPLAEGLVQAWLGTSDLADDGGMGSIARTPASTETFEMEQTPSPGSGDVCVRNSNWPCPGGAIGFEETYPYTVRQYEDGTGCDIVEFWAIHGLEHAYPNADPATHFSDPLGPDITRAAYEFLRQHTLAGPCS